MVIHILRPSTTKSGQHYGVMSALSSCRTPGVPLGGGGGSCHMTLDSLSMKRNSRNRMWPIYGSQSNVCILPHPQNYPQSLAVLSGLPSVPELRLVKLSIIMWWWSRVTAGGARPLAWVSVFLLSIWMLWRVSSHSSLSLSQCQNVASLYFQASEAVLQNELFRRCRYNVGRVDSIHCSHQGNSPTGILQRLRQVALGLCHLYVSTKRKFRSGK